MVAERWRPIAGFAHYDVSDCGRVRSWLNPGRNGIRRSPVIRALVPDKEGYLTVTLRRDGKNFCCKVHRLVLIAFGGPCPAGKEVRHRNGIPNDNRLSNLLWGTRREQFEDQVVHGTDTRGERNGQAKLTYKQAEDIRRMLASGARAGSIAVDVGVSQATVSRIKHGLRYAC
jgi:HNH endonuclease/NUMOD4 motif